MNQTGIFFRFMLLIHPKNAALGWSLSPVFLRTATFMQLLNCFYKIRIIPFYSTTYFLSKRYNIPCIYKKDTEYFEQNGEGGAVQSEYGEHETQFDRQFSTSQLHGMECLNAHGL
ncbi:hypothetical protein [Sporolactobacillus sp. THM19-2]|uniref:hypothetical protein n=1 Tax=Sporolactobacillus sp. THM19-2 TaxID=2511171 RepID=UPI0010202FFB|nr:hypothetical protein [Sporolactobacillus sp. THM19-2]RYL93944.1 hypothetical protein EWH91_01990 [Sporolactobacillus sp. THM19-2]